jgi:LysR family nitrogen assimilation transcriptional regulator
MLKPRDLALLNDFLVVCEQGNLTRAADALNTVQSGVTQRIKRLESAIGCELFVRHSRGVGLTERGELLAKYARKIQALVDDANAEISAWEGSPIGSISIGLPPSVATVLTAPLIDAINAALPRVELTVAEAFSGYLFNWLETGEIDFGFVFNPVRSAGIEITSLAQESLFLITTATNRSNFPAEASIFDLEGIPLIAPSRRHTLRTDLESIARQNGVALNVCLEVDAGHQLIRQILNGKGCAVLAQSSVTPELHEGLLAAVPMTNPHYTREVCLVERLDRRHSLIQTRVRAVIKEVTEFLISSGEWPGAAFKS